MKRRQMRRRVAVLAIALGIAVVWTGIASAYQIVYYFGSQSNPVRISNGTYGPNYTSGSAFRLFNEATAKTSGCGGFGCGYMNTVHLYYNSTVIGQSSNTYYFRVYRNGSDQRSGCRRVNMWGIGGNAPAYVWCDTSI